MNGGGDRYLLNYHGKDKMDFHDKTDSEPDLALIASG